jgi:hypothetical protein
MRLCRKSARETILFAGEQPSTHVAGRDYRQSNASAASAIFAAVKPCFW